MSSKGPQSITKNAKPETMPRKSKGKRLGLGATCAPLLKFLHSSDKLAEKFPNVVPGQWLKDCVVQRRGMASRKGKDFNAIFFTSPTLPDVELWCATRYALVRTEGHPSEFFEVRAAAGAPPGALPPNTDDREDDNFEARNRAEDIALIENQGFDVDDDNHPAVENIPMKNAPATASDGFTLARSEDGRASTSDASTTPQSSCQVSTTVGRSRVRCGLRFFLLWPTVWFTRPYPRWTIYSDRSVQIISFILFLWF